MIVGIWFMIEHFTKLIIGFLLVKFFNTVKYTIQFFEDSTKLFIFYFQPITEQLNDSLTGISIP